MITNYPQLNRQLDDYKVQLQGVTAKLSSSEEQFKSLEAKIKMLQDERDSLKKEVADKDEETKQVAASTNKQVIQKMSTLGIEQGTITESMSTAFVPGTEMTVQVNEPKALYDKWDKMARSKQKEQFFKEHRSEILDYMKVVHVDQNPVVANMSNFSYFVPDASSLTRNTLKK